MQNLNYGQKETALILAGRTRSVQPSGDLFVAVYDYTTIEEYNSMRENYLQMEEDIAALYEWNRTHSTNYTVTGKNSVNGNVNIDDDPSHPFPPIKH